MKSCAVKIDPDGKIKKPKFFGCLICYTGGWIWFGVQKLRALRG